MPDGAELFHPTFLDGRNVCAVIDALVRSSNEGGGWQKVNWLKA